MIASTSARGVWDLIGNTPVLPLHFAEAGVTIHAKCEFLNPSGKDSIANFINDPAAQPRMGLLVGTSSGANVAAALKLAARQPVDGAIVTLLCDRAERYFSTELFTR